MTMFPQSFNQALQMVIARASARHLMATGKPLRLSIIAQDVGIDVFELEFALQGQSSLNLHVLLPLLVYLGCNEQEQRYLFHLAELALVCDLPRAGDYTTEKSPATLIFYTDLDSDKERTTDKRPSL